jgi:hypothetical protein
MAEGPTSVLSDYAKEADDFEHVIDHCVLEGAYSQHNTYITINLDEHPTQLASRILIMRYLNAGWSKMQIHSSQRDGSWVQLYF